MRSTSWARAAAWKERSSLEQLGREGLFAALLLRFETARIDVIAVSGEQLQGNRAVVDVESGVLKYDESLSPEEVNEILAHELGHLVLHGRLTDASASFDPIMASVYADQGPAAIARYSPRMREEAEANAFAFEYVCPSDKLLAVWRTERAPTISGLAALLGTSPRVVRVQLANALHDLAVGVEPGERPRERKENVALTGEQREAAQAVGSPILVDAGAGTGKTATLVGRVEFLLAEKGARPEQLLILTFSNEAAQELSDRIADQLGQGVARAMTISTFHGLGMEFLSLHGGFVEFSEDPRLLDKDAQIELVFEILGRVPCSHPALLRDPWSTAALFVEHINRCKDQLVDPQSLEKRLEHESEDHLSGAELVAVYREYERSKHEAGRADFADLIALPLRVLKENDEVRAAWQARFPWVLVDEFQDVSRATSNLLRALCGSENPPWVVGDARQAIYRFLGASPDNVRDFQSDFPGARLFSLEVNYRSCTPIIEQANVLADIMARDGASARDPHRWRRGSNAVPLTDNPVLLAEATSDYAESVGVVEQVRSWIESGIAPGDIAVLARRHVDVRNTMLLLTEAEVKAQAAGLLTAEGAGGDLAAAVIAADTPRTALPRLVFALARGSLAREGANEIARALLNGEPVVGAVPEEINAVLEKADEEKFSADGWIALTSFLFESSGYLKRILDSPDTAERAVNLIEIASTLAMAAAYAATHPSEAPRRSRVGFGARLRDRLTETTPLPILPKARPDVVRVMTCHAAKGLEFPCVIVSGQTIPTVPSKYSWLPQSLRPASSDDDEQADALLFVGVTRAKQAVVVSWPTHAGQSVRARSKRVVALLEHWREQSNIPVLTWNALRTSDAVALGRPVWGFPTVDELNASALGSGVCSLLTYIETVLDLRFPEDEIALYPRFFAAVRRSLRKVVEMANAARAVVSHIEADQLFDAEWPADRYRDHPHYQLYRFTARDIVRGFASAFLPGAIGSEILEPQLESLARSAGPVLILDLIAYFREPSGRIVAIIFRPESFATKSKNGALSWSRVEEGKRISFVLAEAYVGNISAHVFSGADQAIYEYSLKSQNKREDSLGREALELSQRYGALTTGDFTTEVNLFMCDRCRARITCPYWLGAL